MWLGKQRSQRMTVSLGGLEGHKAGTAPHILEAEPEAASTGCCGIFFRSKKPVVTPASPTAANVPPAGSGPPGRDDDALSVYEELDWATLFERIQL